MSINPHTENERKTRRFKGLVAGVAGLALLLGGATFAKWSDTADGSLTPINNGDLDISRSSTGYYDLNESGTDDAIGQTDVTDITSLVLDRTWQAVPGDNVEIDLRHIINLAGTNMNAKLTMAPAAGSINPTTGGWTVSYTVYVDGVALPGGGAITGAINAASPITLLTGLTAADNNKEVDVVFTTALPSSVSGQAHTQTQYSVDAAATSAMLNLSGLQLTLTQV